MNILKKRIVPSIVLSGIAASALISVLLISRPANIEGVDSEEPTSTIATLTHRGAFEKGYVTDLVVANIEPHTISVQRGQTVEIPVMIEHLSNSELSTDVTVTNFHNLFRNFVPSAAEGLEAEEFYELRKENVFVEGEIKIDDYITTSPPLVTLPPNSSRTITMTVTIPRDLPAEMTGKSIIIGLGFDILPPSSQINTLNASVALVVID